MRWYDRHEKLAKYLDGLKDMDPDIRTHVVRRLLSALRAEHPQLVSADSVLEFPLDFRRRRWYDKDPYLWLVMNGLSNAPHDFLVKITGILEEEYLSIARMEKAICAERPSPA